MLGTPTSPRTHRPDTRRSALEFIHRLLILPSEEHASLDELLDDLSTAFAATAAGLATFPEIEPVCIQSTPSSGLQSATFPLWREQARPSERLSNASDALSLPNRAGGSCLVTLLGASERGGWLLWLEDTDGSDWSSSDAALLTMAGQALAHYLTRDETRTPWVLQLDRDVRRQRMDAAGRIIRRLAHDFGNVLTGILGFSELALAHTAAAKSPLYEFLTEIHRGAQNGAQYISQLRLLARRQATCHRSCNVAELLAKWLDDSSAAFRGDVQLRLHIPADLPSVALDAESLRQVLTIVLENARNAITGAGVIEVSARVVQLSATEARMTLGDVRAGPYVEIRVADNGCGLTPEAQRLLFVEPFFSTKPRKYGFGLALAYGILAAHLGGLELLPRPEGGTIARSLVPVTPASL